MAKDGLSHVHLFRLEILRCSFLLRDFGDEKSVTEKQSCGRLLFCHFLPSRAVRKANRIDIVIITYRNLRSLHYASFNTDIHFCLLEPDNRFLVHPRQSHRIPSRFCSRSRPFASPWRSIYSTFSILLRIACAAFQALH